MYKGLHLNARNTDTDVIDQWIERKVEAPADLERLLNHIHMYDFFPNIPDKGELEGFANEIVQDWGKTLFDLDSRYRVITYEGYGPEVTFYFDRGVPDAV